MGNAFAWWPEMIRRGSAECLHCAAVAWENLASVCFWIISVGSLHIIPRVSQGPGRDRLGAAVMLEFWDLAHSVMVTPEGWMPPPPSALWALSLLGGLGRV